MKLDCAVITDHERAFTIAIVPRPVLEDSIAAQKTLHVLQRRTFHMPTVLMALDASGVPTQYYGPVELVPRVLQAPLERIAWGQVALEFRRAA